MSARPRIILGEMAGEGIPPPADPDAIELLGWLDLPLDDAPAALVTTFNEGWIPSVSTADALLPNRLREALGLMHNDRRLARDAYFVALLCASRQQLQECSLPIATARAIRWPPAACSF